MAEYIPVHMGLLGHIDHGKTELARALSEKVSTAGLDQHPQSKIRGITIDLGFTMFHLDNYLVTLVDAPGHADLIRSVVAGANIIDAAILVIAADQGPQLQTGEHIVVLSLLGVKSIVVAITKADLVPASQLESIEAQSRVILHSAGYSDVEFVPVSAINNSGIDELRDALRRTIAPNPRDKDGTFLMPLDHAFSKKGHGTIVTGTVLRGKFHIGGNLQLIPHGTSVKIRAIQVFGTERDSTSAGDRIGMNIPEVDAEDIRRGDYLCESESIIVSRGIICSLTLNPLFNGRITKNLIVNSMIGMSSITSEIIPVVPYLDSYMIVDEPKGNRFDVALLLQRDVGVEIGMAYLLMRTDLPPTSMRIIGSGEISEIPKTISLYRKRTRRGSVSRVRDDDVLIEGLSHSKRSAEKLIGSDVKLRSGEVGRLKQTFGTRGVIIAEFKKHPAENDEVLYDQITKEEYEFGH
ncbi:MAG: selenocysteine-specific translation elongation factor [Candidatus Thorarchaeota archaeon]